MDQHRPDLVYTDGGVFGDVGRQLMAHYYNANMAWNRGRMDGVYTIKHSIGGRHGEFQDGISVLDVERGVVDGIHPEPWQTDTCIGNWYYHEGFKYKTARDVIHMLVDIVSKNGNLLLNFPLLPDGTLDAEEEKVLEGITDWMAVNGEAIHGTRPWKVYGGRPHHDRGRNFRREEGQAADASRHPFHHQRRYALRLLHGVAGR